MRPLLESLLASSLSSAEVAATPLTIRKTPDPWQTPARADDVRPDEISFQAGSSSSPPS
jgi:hypothetical protein